MEIIQRRPAAGEAHPRGEAIVLGTTNAYVEEQRSLTTVTFVRSGIRLQIATNLGRAEALAVAASLR